MTARQNAMMATFEDYLTDAASPHHWHTVLVTSISVAMSGERRRTVLADFSAATATVDKVIVSLLGIKASTFHLAVGVACPWITRVRLVSSGAAPEMEGGRMRD